MRFTVSDWNIKELTVTEKVRSWVWSYILSGIISHPWEWIWGLGSKFPSVTAELPPLWPEHWLHQCFHMNNVPKQLTMPPTQQQLFKELHKRSTVGLWRIIRLLSERPAFHEPNKDCTASQRVNPSKLWHINNKVTEDFMALVFLATVTPEP